MKDVSEAMLGRFADGLQELIAHGGSAVRGPGDGTVDGSATASRQPSATQTGHVRAAASSDDDDVLDVGSTIWSLVPRRSVAAAAAVAVGGLALLGRRRRRGVELSVTFRWR
jgi:hypothetical protein